MSKDDILLNIKYIYSNNLIAKQSKRITLAMRSYNKVTLVNAWAIVRKICIS